VTKARVAPWHAGTQELPWNSQAGEKRGGRKREMRRRWSARVLSGQVFTFGRDLREELVIGRLITG
jgi:hypothetical protein